MFLYATSPHFYNPFLLHSFLIRKILCEQRQMRFESTGFDNLLQTPFHDIRGLEVNPSITFKSAPADLLNYSDDIRTLDIFRLSLTHINV